MSRTFIKPSSRNIRWNPVDDVDAYYYNQNKYALQYQPIVPVPYDTYERLEMNREELYDILKMNIYNKLKKKLKYFNKTTR